MPTFARDPFARTRARPVQLLNATVNGASIAYSNYTEFYVQVRKHGRKYQTRYCFVGDLAAAIERYEAITPSRDWSKRIYAPSIVPTPTLVEKLSIWAMSDEEYYSIPRDNDDELWSEEELDEMESEA